ncbi:sugar ABC transporter substrate-binding protein [Streptacidiphilus pinicola]|uniref:Sugar ABC transporter substrate-binding protein n=1 Tax=Streptacidiphilus pinicola TaxID=2219663 RepID=A0A2X0IPN9_9ACTN|nr:extracellular solute-binding protein [Streptacidiphilus pinicola]RAG85513.1 sugar ABC transporter substrate-binding protein [Streptacidiphilus pinicola]
MHRPRPTRLAALALALATAFAATGCGTGSLAPGRTRVEPADTLTMWTFKQTHVAALEQAAAAFRRQTGVTVTITAYTPDDAFSSKLESAAATGQLADVIEVHAGGEDRTLGGAQIADDLSKDFTSAQLAAFLPGTAEAGRITPAVQQASLAPQATDPGVRVGQLFSVPLTAGTFGIVYADRAQLTAAGLDPAHPPTTWQQFVAWLAAVHRHDPRHGGLTVGLRTSSTAFQWLLEPLAYADLGAQRYHALFGKNPDTDWAGPDGQAVLRLYDQITPYWQPGTQSLGIDDADRAFAQGKAAFDLGGTFTLASVRQDGMRADQVVAFPVPAPAGGAARTLRLAPIALTGLTVTTSSPHKAAALAWIRFLTSPQQAAAFARASLDLPATDLGAATANVVGPQAAALEQAFGPPGPDTYTPNDTTFKPPAEDDEQLGDVLVRLSPLRESTAAAAARQLGTLTTDDWK